MNKLQKELASYSIRLTKPRLAVLKQLNQAKKPLSAKELHEAIEEHDQASVYRALKLFEKIAIAKAEIIGKEKLYCAKKEPHHHIICKKCGIIDSLPCNHIEYKHANFTNIEHHLTLKGICKKCTNKSK